MLPAGPILVLGGSGQLGSALVAAWSGEREVVAPPHAALDVRDPAAVAAALAAHRAAAVVNTTAFHDVAGCERDPALAFEINAAAVDRLAAASAAAGALFLTVSTDYVFAGDARRPYVERDPALPPGVYGVSKLAGELLARRHGGRWSVVRTAGLYGPSGRSNKGPILIERLAAAARRGETPRVVDDVVFSPSYAPHVAAAVVALVEQEAVGLFHVAGGGAVSWHAFAAAALDAMGLPPPEPVPSSGFAPGPPRPAYAALASEALAAAGVAAPPDWRAGLDEYLAARAAKA